MTGIITIETTGFGEDAEVLSIEIADARSGRSVFYMLFGTRYHKEWAQAQARNGIAPADVEGLAPFLCRSRLNAVRAVLDGFDGAVVYNAGFIAPILLEAGCIDADFKFCDAMVGARIAMAKLGDAGSKYNDYYGSYCNRSRDDVAEFMSKQESNAGLSFDGGKTCIDWNIYLACIRAGITVDEMLVTAGAPVRGDERVEVVES
jgi:hypothetical protein